MFLPKDEDHHHLPVAVDDDHLIDVDVEDHHVDSVSHEN